MLTRKNYTEIAKIINKNKIAVRIGRNPTSPSWGLPLNKFVEDLTEYLIEDNDRFDTEKFRVACGVRNND
jgi:hypothetical protein